MRGKNVKTAGSGAATTNNYRIKNGGWTRWEKRRDDGAQQEKNRSQGECKQAAGL